ncbi:oligosaccharide flippase family protein, partial [Sphingobacterium cellulitidis]|uniref:oligosaccharide flippase family protein n=1 Tax=Sphingobacterium cellulitidis TaxID=1768011 RepID=UPI001181A73C
MSKRLLNNSLWAIIGHIGTLGVSLVANIIIARLLSPDDFGRIGIIMFFILISNVLLEGGLSGALLRKKQITQIDYSTIFVFNFFVSLICFLLIIIFSNSISNYYNDTKLFYPLIVTSSILVINAFQITPNTKLMADLEYKRRSVFQIISIILSSLISIILAYYGAGLWALVALQVLRSLFYTIILIIFEKNVISFKFDKQVFKGFFSFGINTTATSILTLVFDNIYQLVLGKYFTLGQAGYFFQAKKLQEVPGGVLTMLTQGVIYSSLAKFQDDKNAFFKAYTNIFRLFVAILGLITLIFFVYSELIINILLGEKWVEAAFFLKVLSLSSFFYIQESFNRMIFKIFNHTRKLLNLELLKKGIQLLTIILGVLLKNIEILIYGFLLVSIVGYVLNYIVSRKIISSSGFREIKTIIMIILIFVFIVALYWFAQSKFN